MDPAQAARIDAIQKKETRWMGMIVGIFVLALGVFGLVIIATIAITLAVAPGPHAPIPGFLLIGAAVYTPVSILLVFYGHSVFRRSRTDAEVVATISLPTEGGRYRTLAWVALAFSALMLISAAAILVVSLAKGQAPGALAYNAGWFVVVFAAAVRYLRQTRRNKTT